MCRCSSRVLSLSELFDRFERTAFLVYAGALAWLLIVGFIFVRHLNRLHHAAFDLKDGASIREYTPELALIHRFGSAALSGIVGAQSVLFAKVSVACLVLSIGLAYNFYALQCTAEMLKILVQGKGVLFLHWQVCIVGSIGLLCNHESVCPRRRIWSFWVWGHAYSCRLDG